MFKCIACGGDTKTVQTVHTEEEGTQVVLRRCKCKECNAMFITKESFERYTEHCIKDRVKSAPGARSLDRFMDRLKTMQQTDAVVTSGKTDVVVTRGENPMIKLVSSTAPMSLDDWERLQQMIGDIDTSDVKMIPPEGE